MNLSQRLDAAKKARRQGEAPSEDRQGLLRMTVDDRTYDGTDVRTGAELTTDDWHDREQDAETYGPKLPSWNPNRANADLAEDEWVAEAPDTDETAEVIDLTRPTPPSEPSDDGFQMPGWAGDAQIYQADGITKPATPADAIPCPSCGGTAELKHLDLLNNKADLECEQCGLLWSEAAQQHAPHAR